MVCTGRSHDGTNVVVLWSTCVYQYSGNTLGASLLCDRKVFLFPFGHEAVARDELTKQKDIGTGTLGLIGNVIWFIFAGVWLAIGHIMSAVACFITIIGIPFALQHLKLAYISLAPIGKTICT